LRGRLALGYAFRAFEAARHRLDGAFAGAEVGDGRFVSARSSTTASG